jgi:hypothetical protein
MLYFDTVLVWECGNILYVLVLTCTVRGQWMKTEDVYFVLGLLYFNYWVCDATRCKIIT